MESWTELIADIIPLDILVTRMIEEGEFIGFDCLFHIGNVLTESQTFLGREGECLKRLTTHIEKIHTAYGQIETMSGCCQAKIIHTDICSDCKEHCDVEPMESAELDF